MKGIIYCIERIKTGKKYIGQHLGVIEDNYWGSGSAISKAIKKYGKKSFKKYILEECNLEDLNEREQYWIKCYNTFLGEGYNMDDGGKSNSGYWATLDDDKKAEIHKKRLNNRPDDFKERCKLAAKDRDFSYLSEKLKGRIYSKETLSKMSESAKKRGVIEKNIQKAWDAKRGSKLTPEQCNNISKATKGKKKPPRTEEHKSKLRKPVNQFDLQGNFIKTHESVSSASLETGGDYTGVSNCANGKLKTSGGFIWKWAKNYL
jgi:group I intron endonuclease